MDVKQHSTQQSVLHHYGSVGEGVEQLGVCMNIIINIIIIIIMQPQAVGFVCTNTSAHQAASFLC